MDEKHQQDWSGRAAPGRQPLYASLAAVLTRDIQEGKHPPESILPSEKELTERYGVSRQTVRQALRVLREQGLISSHPGIGTLVRAQSGPTTFSSVNSIQDLLQFVGTTQMHALGLSDVTVDAALAQQLECKAGLQLSMVEFVRKTAGDDRPMSYVRIYNHPRFAAAQVTEAVTNVPVYKTIERMFGVRVHEVRQDITATVLDDALARILDAQPGAPALKIVRFYYDVNGTSVQTSISFYPSDRYTQSARFRTTNDMTS